MNFKKIKSIGFFLIVLILFSIPIPVFSIGTESLFVTDDKQDDNSSNKQAEKKESNSKSTDGGKDSRESKKSEDEKEQAGGEQETKAAELYATGDWGKTRQKMMDRGVGVELVYTGEVLKNILGGISPGYAVVGNLDLTLDVDFQKFMGWSGALFHLYWLAGHRSADPTGIVGDLQGSSNIEAGMDYFKLYEVWFQQNLFNDGVSLLVGLHDLNSEFYADDGAGLFFNSSMGIGNEFAQAGINGPSIFPSTALAARLKLEPFKNFSVSGGVYNAIAGNLTNPTSSQVDTTFQDGFLVVSELAYATEGDLKVALGGWMFNKQTTDIANSSLPASRRGLYFLIDKTWNDSFEVFLRAGMADPNAFLVEYNVAEGIVLHGKLWKRDDDQLGLGVTTVIASDVARNSIIAGGQSMDNQESAFELTYLLQVTPWMSLQPDFQYIMNPSMDPLVQDAFVISWRAVLSF